MYILGIETTGREGSVCLLRKAENGRDAGAGTEPQVMAEKKIEGSMSHLRELIPSISEVLTAAGVSKGEISFIAASAGPGSFTGIRIGVSTARALSQALDLEHAISVPTLTAFLYKREAREAKAGGKVICPIINARRGQVYGMVDGYLPDGPYMLTEVLQVIKERVFAEGREVLFFGDGIDAYESLIDDELAELGKYGFAEVSFRYQDAASVALCAAKNIERYLVKSENLLPDYMRKAEAEQKLAAGQLPICKGPKQE